MVSRAVAILFGLAFAPAVFAESGPAATAPALISMA